MKLIYKSLLFTAFSASLLFSFSSCKDEQEEMNATTSIAAIYPTVVMEGTTLQVTGSGLDKTLRVIFPGEKAAEYVESKGEQLLLVKVPADISSEEAPLVIITPTGEVVTRQTLRKEAPRLTIFIPSQEGAPDNEFSIVCHDFL